jgi:hypothetical protein
MEHRQVGTELPQLVRLCTFQDTGFCRNQRQDGAREGSNTGSAVDLLHGLFLCWMMDLGQQPRHWLSIGFEEIQT